MAGGAGSGGRGARTSVGVATLTVVTATDAIVWVDCEMTGLDLTKDALVEIAVVVTDSELTPLGPGIDLVIAPPEGVVEGMLPVVREMHTRSGLLDDLADGIPLADAERQALDYIRRYVPDAGKAPLAGNSVGTDKTFLDRDMPDLMGHLHYRIIDVSSIKELARRWYPRAYFNSPKKAGGHRALADILESIDELRYYRSVLFPGAPGPDSATAKRLASEVLASPTTLPPAQA